MNAYIEFISKHTTLTNEEIIHFEKAIKIKCYKPNKIILSNGSVCNALRFIARGSAKSFFINNEGNRIHLALSLQ